MADTESLVPRLSGAIDTDRMRAMPLAPTDGFILSRIDGATSARELAETTGVGIDAVLAALAKLHHLGLIVMPGAASAPKATSSAAKLPPPPPSSSKAVTAPPEAAVDPTIELDAEHQRQISSIFAKLDQTDHYELLGIPRTADKKSVKRAYYELTARFHPDRFFRKKMGPFKAQMEAIFARMSEANEMLTSDRRPEYDAYLGSLDQSRHIEQMVEEASAEIRRVEEAALGVTLSSAPPPPPSSSSLRAPASSRFPNESPTAARSVPSPAPSSSSSHSSPASAHRSEPPDAQTRRELLARRLTGPAGRSASSGSFRAPVAPKVPTIAYTKSEDAVDALKRRYEDKVSAAKTNQAKKYADSGMAARARGDVVAAANALRVAVTFDAGNAELKAAYDEAQRASDLLLAEQYVKQADFEEKAEKWAEAGRSWQRVARARENDLKAHERAAHCIVMAGGNLHDAAALAQRAVQLAPRSAHPHVLLANVYLAAGLAKNARREAEAALAISPDDAAAHALLKRLGKQD